ncbi:hypothetical protein [Paraburkholderia sp. BL21I4N1]|uniref:hypothetical protein n=1 Tax=Paraburkholderia sp. BL21I4N1 TaxID=1938801 RepID=UPI000CFBD7D1|nr:hypothetical protein [Paraburkholderia sp. BL21I4N1]PQV52730.1 hypothetical protein B0G83_103482 [Paraburkholderia sp. BL21I4N1]
MEERQVHRGFSIVVTTHDDPTGGSNVTLLIERVPISGEHVRGTATMPEPEHYRSLLTGPAAMGEAIERAKHAIDDALGDRDPLDDG